MESVTSTSTLTRTLHLDRRQVITRALAIGFAACFLLALPFVFYYDSEVQRLQDSAAAGAAHTVELASQLSTQTLQSVVSDLRYLSHQNEIRELLKDASAAHVARLAEEYAIFLRQKPAYDQVRVIATDGMEVVRVDRREGQAAITPPEQLQNKAARYYFKETMALGPTDIYVSPLDLNVDQGRVEEPIKPTLRAAIPLFDSSGRRAGILSLSFLAGRLITQLRALTRPGETELWLLNADGYWLMGANAADEWAFMYPERVDRSMAVRDPALWQRLSQEPSGSIRHPDGLLAFARIYPLLAGQDQGTPPVALPAPASAGDYYWITVARVPATLLESQSKDLARNLLLAYAALSLLAFGLATALAFVSLRSKALSLFVQHVLDQVPVLVAYVDADERYRYNNRYYETTFGLRRRDLSGKTIRSVLGDAAYEQLRPYVATALSGRTVSFESTMDYAVAGRRNVSATYMPDVGEDGRIWGFVAVVSDVTELKAAERRYREQMLEIAHATRLASVGELATQIAHEVNQPLTAIVTYCAAAQRHLRQEPVDGARLAGLIASIADEAKRVSDVIRRLRAFIRKGEISFAAVDVNEVVVDTIRLISADARAKKVALHEALASGPLTVMADPVLLSQAILNLVRNAVDAVAAGHGPDCLVIVATERKDAVVELSVRDTGPGLPPEVAAQLFTSFVTTKEGGLGMGLAIARSIVEAHGGQVRHTNAPGGGALFLIHLPGVDT